MLIRTTAALLLPLLLGAPIGAQTRKSDRELEGLKRRVKAVRVETAKLSKKAAQWVESKRELNSTTFYDENGDLVERLYPWRGPSFQNRHLYSYDEDGNRLEKQCREGVVAPPKLTDFSGGHRPDDGSILSRWLMKYDGDGNRIEEQAFFGGARPMVKTTHRYEGGSRRVASATYRSDGSLLSRVQYKYDAGGGVIELIRYRDERSSSDSEHLIYSGLEYDASGNWIKRVTSRLQTKDGKSYSEPEAVTYRRIDYY